MRVFEQLFKQTFIYGIATVLPRILTVLLTRLYTDKLPADAYGIMTVIFSGMLFFNVLLSYGMETAFFRFITKSSDKDKVQATALLSLLITTLIFFAVAFGFRTSLAHLLDIKTKYISYAIFILTLDTLVVIPFAWLRHKKMPIKYTIIKTGNVMINLLLNIFFFLWLPQIAQENITLLNRIYTTQDQVSYIFISNTIASITTLVLLCPLYFRIGFRLDTAILKKMLRYGFPILIAGVAFSINEHSDKIFLKYLLPENIADSEVGVYAACYKLGVFMTLFITAFKLGIEPFFFTQATQKEAKETYAMLMRYFIIFGSFILLVVVVYADIIKQLLIADKVYWVAMPIVPVILMANLCLGIYYNLSVWYKITDNTKYGAYISVLGALITLILNIVLIPIFSYKGSAFATLAAYASMMLVSYLLGKKQYPIPYNLKKIGMYLFTAIVFSILSFYLFNGNLIAGNLFLFLFLMLIYLFERKYIQRTSIKNESSDH